MPSTSSGYTGCTSKPPIPPSFMSRISRSSSGFVTAGPNHHQRIIMRASSGGFSKPRRTSATLCAAIVVEAASNRQAKRSISIQNFHRDIPPAAHGTRRPPILPERIGRTVAVNFERDVAGPTEFFDQALRLPARCFHLLRVEFGDLL